MIFLRRNKRNFSLLYFDSFVNVDSLADKETVITVVNLSDLLK